MGDNDFPAVMANGGKSFVDGYIRRKNLYSQSGSDIPALSVEQDFEQELGKPAIETVRILKTNLKLKHNFEAKCQKKFN